MRAYATTRRIGFVLTAAGAWACGGGDAAAPPMTGTVVGQVNVDGSGQAGLTVHLRAIGAATDARPAQTTSAQGTYTFTQVVPDEYRVFVDLPDTIAADPGPSESTVTVEAGMISNVVTFDLRRLIGTVQGFVTDTVPAPLVSRTVTLRRVDSGAERAVATRPSGSYTFTSVTIGDYAIEVQLACGEPHPGSEAVTVIDGQTVVVDTIKVTPRSSDLLLTCDIQPIFTAECASSGCHGPVLPQLNLNLSSPEAVRSTAIGIQSSQVPALNRIEPFDSDTSASYLVCKIVDGCPQLVLSRMPEDGPPLTSAEIDAIRMWIDQGAQDVPATN